MELARGTVGDKPWALTLATFARHNTSGQITLVASDGKRYSIAFDRGLIVAARSPMIADSAARVALTTRIVTSEHVAELARRHQAKPNADDVTLLGEIAKLSPAQLHRLRADVTLRRAARTFSVEAGQYVLEDKICLPVAGCEVDVRAAIYQGLHLHAGDERLRSELRALCGSTSSATFALEQHASGELHRFGFSDDEWPLLAALREGATTLPELEVRLRQIDSRTMQAVVYALVVCGVARVIATGRTPTPSVGRTPTPPSMGRTNTPLPTAPQATEPEETGFAVTFSRTSTSQPAEPRTITPIGRLAMSAPTVGRAPTPMLSIPTSTRDLERMSVTSTRDLERVAMGRTRTNPELAADAAERAQRALALDKPELAVLELKQACELMPNNIDYGALLGWALFCAADDKRAVAPIARKALETAVAKSANPHVARFYLGRIERMLGRDQEALGHFHAVLLMQPDNRDASAEIRVLQARMRGPRTPEI